jgi:hypothetical protein
MFDPGAQRAYPPGVKDAPHATANSDRVQRAREVVVLVKRALSTFRSYAVGHEARKTAIGELLAAIQRMLTVDGGFELQITSKAYYFDDEPLVTEEREDDSTTRPLFVEGIQAVIFQPAVTREELSQFVTLWHIGATGRFPDGRSLSTELWDADFKGIETRVVENFSEGAEIDGEAQQNGQRHEELTVALVKGMSAERLPGGRAVHHGDLRMVSGADLLPLTSAAAANVSDDALQRFAANRRTAIEALTPDEQRSLTNELFAAGVPGPRVHRALWRLLPDADAADTEVTREVVGRVTRRLLDDGALDQLRAALGQTVLAARTDFARASQLGTFFRALAVADVVERLVDATRTPALRADAVAVLSFLDVGAMALVLAVFERVVDDDDARTVVVDLLVRKGTPAAVFAATVPKLTGASAPAAMTAFIEATQRVRADALAEVIDAGLVHPLAAVRRLAVQKTSVELAVTIAPALARALGAERDADARRELISLLMRARSPAAIEPLVALLARPGLDAVERQTALRALSAFGPAPGVAAVNAVLQLFENEKDVDVRASCALALGSIGDHRVRGPLETESRRLLANKAVKAACLEALKRMDARTGGGRA